MKESWSDCEKEEEKVGGKVMIRSDPNYAGEIEPHIGRGRVQAPPADTRELLSDSRMLELLIRIWASQKFLQNLKPLTRSHLQSSPSNTLYHVYNS